MTLRERLDALIANDDLDWSPMVDKFMKDAVAEVERLEAALNKIASWSEGPSVNGSFDEPNSAEMARTALKEKP